MTFQVEEYAVVARADTYGKNSLNCTFKICAFHYRQITPKLKNTLLPWKVMLVSLQQVYTVRLEEVKQVV